MKQVRMLDAQAAMSFVTGQTTYIERQVNEQLYPELNYALLVPVDNQANPWAKTVTYYSADQFGKADWINGNADDIPMAGTERSKNETAVYMAGVGYGYGLEEISQAAQLGYALTADDAKAARRAYEEMMYRVALVGDASKGFEGLINSERPTVQEAITGDWATATAEQIMGDINAALAYQSEGTNFMALANTLLMSHTRRNILATRMVAGVIPMTLWQWFATNNSYTAETGQPLLMRAVRGLETAGEGGVERLVAYRRDENVVKIHIPMPHRFLPVWQSGPMRWDVPGIFRTGGTDIRRPKEVLYLDGV